MSYTATLAISTVGIVMPVSTTSGWVLHGAGIVVHAEAIDTCLSALTGPLFVALG